jgi:hypothetical protein
VGYDLGPRCEPDDVLVDPIIQVHNLDEFPEVIVENLSVTDNTHSNSQTITVILMMMVVMKMGSDEYSMMRMIKTYEMVL